MRLSGKVTETSPTISLTPLIDVVFILLIFFMLASSFLDWRELPIQGQADSSAPSVTTSPSETIHLSLLRNGNIKLGTRVIAQKDLPRALSRQDTILEAIKTFVRVEDGVEMQKTLDFLESLKVLGLRDLTLLEYAKP